MSDNPAWPDELAKHTVNGEMVVPPGEYFIAGEVEWYFGDDAQYQWACEKVTLAKGQTAQIKVSRNLQRPGAPTLVIGTL